MTQLLRTQDEDSNNIFLGLLVIEDLRKLLGVELVRNMGNIMLWMCVVMHVLYVEDWKIKSAFTHRPKNLCREERQNKM